ncbi:unnamed protein product [Umbelopsis vinacea]
MSTVLEGGPSDNNQQEVRISRSHQPSHTDTDLLNLDVEELELLLIVYNLPIVLDIDARTPPRKKSKFERAYDRRQAKYNAASERRIEGRALRTQRCATCGRTDHSRRSIIKASLENSCRSVDLIDQTTSRRWVTLPYSRTEFLLPSFCNCLRLPASAEPWLMQSYDRFRATWPDQMREIDLGFQGYTPILSQTAQEYAINCCNDVVANFEKRTVDYFFVRLNDENDAWFLADSTVQARKSLAKYAFCKAAGLPVLEPQTPAATKRRVEQCTQWNKISLWTTAKLLIDIPDIFDFTTTGFPTVESVRTERVQFWNKVKTDGVAIDFIFKKAKNEPNNTTPADWRNFLERATIWGVDPGAKDLIVAVDGDYVNIHAELPFSTREPHRVRSTSTREYYHLCGFPQAARKRASWKRASPEAAAIFEGIPTLKTTQIQTLLTATTYIFNHYHIITMCFDQGLRSNRHNKYSMNAPPHNPPLHNNAVVRWTPRPNTKQANDANQRIFIAFGVDIDTRKTHAVEDRHTHVDEWHGNERDWERNNTLDWKQRKGGRAGVDGSGALRVLGLVPGTLVLSVVGSGKSDIDNRSSSSL